MTGSKVKKGVFYAATAITGVVMTAVLGLGLVFPVLVWFPDAMVLALFSDIEPAALAHRLHELTIGVFSWVLLLGVVLQLHRPERKVAPLLGAAAIPVVLSTVEAVNGNFDIAETAPLLFPLLLLGVLHPRAKALVRPGRLHTALAVLTAVAAVPWAVFAVGQARLQQLAVAGDVHAEAGHWGLMTGFAILVLIWALIGASNLPGWRIAGFAAAVSSLFYGFHSLVFPQGASAAPLGWAMAAIAWAAVYAVAAWRRERVGELPVPRATPSHVEG